MRPLGYQRRRIELMLRREGNGSFMLSSPRNWAVGFRSLLRHSFAPQRLAGSHAIRICVCASAGFSGRQRTIAVVMLECIGVGLHIGCRTPFIT